MSEMIYYSLEDIISAYKISKVTLKKKCKAGKINFIECPTALNNLRITMILIPETELYKLEALKISELKYNPRSQPDYYDEYRRQNAIIRAETRLWASKEWKTSDEYYDEYLTYLNSDKYKNGIRAKRLAFDKYRCVMCGTGKNLEVHHITYARLGYEDLYDLVTLCKKCHREIIHEKDKPREII